MIQRVHMFLAEAASAVDAGGHGRVPGQLANLAHRLVASAIHDVLLAVIHVGAEGQHPLRGVISARKAWFVYRGF